MNLDRTFCSGVRCNRTNTCDRFSGRLDEYAKAHPEMDWRLKRISMAQFADHEGRCSMYAPVGEDEVQKRIREMREEWDDGHQAEG